MGKLRLDLRARRTWRFKISTSREVVSQIDVLYRRITDGRDEPSSDTPV